VIEDAPLSTQARDAARQTVTSDTLDRLARLGLICRGVLYGLVGILALQIAFGGSGEEADKTGAIHTVAEQPFGTAVLWLMVLGLAALVVWQLLSAIVGRPKAWDRAKCIGRALIYGVIVASILGYLFGGGSSESGDQQSQDATRSLLELPGGVVLVAAAGAGLIALGGYWFYRGVAKRFLKHLRTYQMSRRTQTTVETLGLVGYVCRAVVAGVAGFFVIRAAVTYDPEEAKGLDATLRSFADTPAGPWLLVAVAAGLLVFAVYTLFEARWHEVGPAGGG
jgi:hypothetical protein